MGKKGLSTVVTTMIIIALSLAAIGMVWVVVNNIISNSSEKIDLGRTTVGLEITSLKIKDFSMDVRVKRNIGKGNLVGVRFNLEDAENSEVIDKSTTMQELEERTFNIRQAELNSVNLQILTKISVAPILESGSGKETLGDIIVFYNVKGGEFVGGGDEEEPECSISDDCPATSRGARECGLGGIVVQNETTYDCDAGICMVSVKEKQIELCDGGGCSDGECVGESLGCIEDDSCGITGFIDSPICVGNESWQNYTTFSCTGGVCSNDTSLDLKENCSLASPPDVCGIDATCVDYAMCSTDEDCYVPIKQCSSPYCMCDYNSNCTQEIMAFSGIVDNTWPLGINEFFDSLTLPGPDSRYQSYYIGFLGSTETRCIGIKEYVSPGEDIPIYIRFSVPESNITAGETYQIWKTWYNCNKSISGG